MRKFLKKVGVTSQQKIEEAVRKGIENNLIDTNKIKVKKDKKVINKKYFFPLID